jgi:hypothetical protein
MTISMYVRDPDRDLVELQAYSTLTDGELRRSIVELVERVAVRTGGHAPRRERRYTPRPS